MRTSIIIALALTALVVMAFAADENNENRRNVRKLVEGDADVRDEAHQRAEPIYNVESRKLSHI
jgi:hypothetical protein